MTDEHQDLPIEFKLRLKAAKAIVSATRLGGSKLALANALKELGNLERRPPSMRDASNATYTEAAELYLELEMPLEAAWVKRHIGINHEYGDRLQQAEQYYDEALALYRAHSKVDDLNYANAVRYPAVIKQRLGKQNESAALWEEAHDRYSKIHPDGLGEGVAEAAAWLTIFAIRNDDRDLASKWFARASQASVKSQDPDTHKFIDEVRQRLERN
jgi:tetratricopeptide (TPR) repeat protein